MADEQERIKEQTSSGVDSELLNQDSNQGGKTPKDPQKEVSAQETEQAGRLKQLRQHKKKQQNKKQAQKPEKVNAFNRGASMILRGCWINLLWSWGLTAIWINIHAFLSLITPKFFCPLGQEWVNRSKSKPKQLKKLGEKWGLGEKALLAFLDFIIACIIVLIVTVIYIIVNPMDTAWEVLKETTVTEIKEWRKEISPQESNGDSGSNTEGGSNE